MPERTINGVSLAYDDAGTGSPLLLIHAGIADRRMWDQVLPKLAQRFRTVCLDLRGFGDTPLPDGPFVYATDAFELLHALGIESADVIGVSMGCRVAMDLVLAHPATVRRLLLVSPALGGWEWGSAMGAFDQAETAALERGDFDEASWLNVRFWVDGPQRDEDAVDPELRRRVFEMQRRAFELDNPAAEGGWLVQGHRGKLEQITQPTLVVVGALDQPDFAAIGRHIAQRVPDARLEIMPGVAHLPPMESPDAFVKLAAEFLAD